MKKYRALWLMNHNTLRPFEVPMLIDMGFEIFCPKSFPYDEGNMSASIDYQYDETLTIPEDVLEVLNRIDFYNDIPNDIMKILNEYFDIAFFGFFPNQLRAMVYGFKGVLVMQAFGLATNVTYTDVIADCLGVSFLEKLKSLGNRFFFAQSYENISEIECRYLQNRAIYLPLGLKNAYVSNKWVGGDHRILFVCPRISTSPYFKNIYEDFKKNFKEYDYVVGGAQPISVEDDKVVGYIPKEQYEYNMTHLDVMFYHSREERHLHYHPIEAVKNGMPLIYMSGGLLESIAGEKTAGCCDTIKEAQAKIKRIMKGDKKFIKKVIDSQEVLLTPFQYDYCRKIWNEEFKKIYPILDEKNIRKTNETKTKIAVILTEGYTGGVLDFTLRFIKGIQKGIKESQENIELVFGYIDKPVFEKNDYFEDLNELGIPIRKFKWKIVNKEYIQNVYQFKEYDFIVEDGRYCILDDGANFFEDCDYLILSVDRVPEQFFTIKPYAVVVHDYIQRYLHEQYGDCYEKEVIDLQRNAESIFVMTPETQKDAVQYAGISENKFKLIPLLFDLIKDEGKHEIDEEYFLWSTNRGKHKNHLKALDALADYYSSGGKLKCYITGVSTKLFDPECDYSENDPYILEIRKKIDEEELLKENLVFWGNMRKKQYINILKNAKFFMHPGFADNGNMTAVDAACFNVPTISGDYPQMRYYEEYMNLGIKFFDPFKTKELTDLLLYMEKNYEKCKSEMPGIEQIKKFTIEETYMQIYTQMKDIFKL